jgi:hypothetical protein
LARATCVLPMNRAGCRRFRSGSQVMCLLRVNVMCWGLGLWEAVITWRQTARWQIVVVTQSPQFVARELTCPPPVDRPGDSVHWGVDHPANLSGRSSWRKPQEWNSCLMVNTLIFVSGGLEFCYPDGCFFVASFFA